MRYRGIWNTLFKEDYVKERSIFHIKCINYPLQTHYAAGKIRSIVLENWAWSLCNGCTKWDRIELYTGYWKRDTYGFQKILCSFTNNIGHLYILSGRVGRMIVFLQTQQYAHVKCISILILLLLFVIEIMKILCDIYFMLN